MTFKVSARSVYLEERRVNDESEMFEFDAEGNPYTRYHVWEASFLGASLHPYGHITISRTGETAKEATANLRAAVEKQGYEWSEA